MACGRDQGHGRRSSRTLTDVRRSHVGVVLMALVGELGTIVGPVVRAFIIITMQNYLARDRWVRSW